MDMCVYVCVCGASAGACNVYHINISSIMIMINVIANEMECI